MASMSWDGYGSLVAKLEELAHPDPSPLLEDWADLLVEGNRRGVLSGVDGFGNRMPALKYRNGKGRKHAGRYNSAAFGSKKFPSQVGPLAVGLHGNLTSAQYRELTGPRLAPRGEQSRVITNLHKEYGADPTASHTWYASARWFDVYSNDGTKFLPFHFDGAGRLPRYDLRPVRPDDVQRASVMARAWLVSIITT